MSVESQAQSCHNPVAHSARPGLYPAVCFRWQGREYETQEGPSSGRSAEWMRGLGMGCPLPRDGGPGVSSPGKF